MSNPTERIPRDHGGMAFDPPLNTWKHEAVRNREWLLKQSFWGQTPRQVRAGLKFPTDQPIILSGHQPILFHPGLWAKCLAAGILAESVQGLACHKVTDTDLSAEHPQFLPEVEENGKARRKRIEFFTNKEHLQLEKATPFAFLPAPDHEALRKVFTDAQVYCPEPVKGRIAAQEERLAKGLVKNATCYDFHAHCLGILDEWSGTQRRLFTASKIWSSPHYLEFVAGWLENLPEMTEAYNKSLEEHRKERGITHELEPVPNLKFENWWLELPFWGVTKYNQRHSLWAKKDGKHLVLRMKGGEGNVNLNLEDLHREVGTASIGIWPKAIPQTLFCRMFLCDFFVHGAGGAAYEDVGNRLFAKVFRANPPVFGMATGTWQVDPEGSRALEAIGSYEAGIQEWRRYLEKNPEAVFTRSGSWRSGLPAFMHPAFEAVLADGTLRKLTEEKASLVGRLQDPAKREEASRRIKSVNEGLGEGVREARKVLEQGLLDVEKVRETREVMSFREYPFFCYDPGLFVQMKDRVREAAHLEKA